MATVISLILYGLLFVGVLFFVNAVTGFIRLAKGSDEEAVERRLSVTAAIGTESTGDRNLLRTQEMSEKWGRYIPFLVPFSKLVEAAGTSITIQRAFVMMASIALIALVPLFILIPASFLPLAIPLAAIIGIGSVLLYLGRAKAKRRAKFEEQLPDAIDLIIRSLKVGHPLSGAMGVISRELPAPISTEFGIAFQEVSYGQDIPTALANMSERMPLPDLRYLTMAVQIQQESGGNLVESLSKLCAVIRERYRMFRKVKALTAEGRFSAWFLSGFPVVVVLGIQAIKPDYFTRVMDFAYFPHLVVATIILLIINVIAMRVVTTIKV